MSEFSEMLKEAFVGDEPFDPSPGRDALRASAEGFERRMRTVRHMAWFAVTFMGFVSILAVIVLVNIHPAESDSKRFAWYAIAALGFTTVGFAKLWFAMMLNHVRVMKELKRTQLMLNELLGAGRGPGEAAGG